jgi:hypothetical protein
VLCHPVSVRLILFGPVPLCAPHGFIVIDIYSLVLLSNSTAIVHTELHPTKPHQMGLKDFIFGKEILFTDTLIGELRTRAKKADPSINYTWTGKHLLKNQKKETAFVLEGNINGPYHDQLKSAQRIAANIDNIISQVDIELKKTKPASSVFAIDWFKYFYVAVIATFDMAKNTFEVCLEPISGHDNGFVNFIWANDSVSQIDAKQ